MSLPQEKIDLLVSYARALYEVSRQCDAVKMVCKKYVENIYELIPRIMDPDQDIADWFSEPREFIKNVIEHLTKDAILGVPPDSVRDVCTEWTAAVPGVSREYRVMFSGSRHRCSHWSNTNHWVDTDPGTWSSARFRPASGEPVIEVYHRAAKRLGEEHARDRKIKLGPELLGTLLKGSHTMSCPVGCFQIYSEAYYGRPCDPDTGRPL